MVVSAGRWRPQQRKSLALAGAGLGLATLTACGTEVVDNAVTVTGGTTEQISVFDWTESDTRDWAMASLGTVSPEVPYRTTLTEVQTRMIFDGSPPETVPVGLMLPGRNDAGYYAANIRPTSEPQQLEARFVPWDPPNASATAATTGHSITVDVTAVEADGSWRLTLMLPPAPAA